MRLILFPPLARTLFLCAVLLALPSVALSQEHGIPPDQVSHGAEKQAHRVAHPEEDHGGGHAAPKTYFGIPAWVLKLLNMLLFFGALAFLLRGPLKRALAERAATIRSQLQEARERRDKADRMAEELQTRLSRLEGELALILRRAEEEGERQKQEMVAAARDEAEKVLRSARNEVDARLKQARKELTDYAGELAASRAHALLEQSLTDADRRKLFDESVESIAERQS